MGGKGGGGSAPSYPDPNVVANATTSTNEATAGYNKALNLNNNSNPFGSQTSKITGYDPASGAPIYQTNTTANPQLQAQISSLMGQTGESGGINNYAFGGLSGLNNRYDILGSQTAALSPQYGNISGKYDALNGQLSSVGQEINPTAAASAQQNGQDAAYSSAMGYLQPQFKQQQTSLDSQLANQGLSPGSEAWKNAEQNLALDQGRQQQQAINNAQVTGASIGTQNYQNQLAAQQARAGILGQQAGIYGQQTGLVGQQAGILGQQAGLLGQQSGLYGQQVSIGQLPYSNLGSIASLVPGYQGTGMSAAAPADMANLYNNQYQSQLAGYNAQQQSANSAQSGLFGLGSAGVMAAGFAF